MVAENQLNEKPEEDKTFDIQIDRTHYEVTGADLRNIPIAPIPSNRDLFEVIPDRLDRKVADDDRILVSDGLRFFTAPNTINPGGPRYDCWMTRCLL